jgi:hypothetical protein
MNKEFYMKLSAKQKIAKYLETNQTRGLTVNQARARFGIKNVSARIDELRKEGHVIYTNTKTRADGTRFHLYRMGKPTKALVRAAVAAGFDFNQPHNEV